MLGRFFRRDLPRTSIMTPGRPQPHPGRTGLAIVAIMKDEAGHITDWLRFHGAAGVRDFYLYDDGSSDGTPDLARSVAGLNVTVLPWRMSGAFEQPNVTFSRQILAYAHAIENFGGAYRWMAFIDIDECIVPTRGTSILEVLEGLGAYTNVSLPWTMFGPNGHDKTPDIPAQFAYTTRAARRADPVLNFKCIVDPTDVTQARVHRFRTTTMGKDSVNDVGVRAPYKNRHLDGFLSDAALQLNHYYTRSHEELAMKLGKGAVSDSPLARRNSKVHEKLAVIEATAIPDTAAIDFLRRVGITRPDALRSATFAHDATPAPESDQSRDP